MSRKQIALSSLLFVFLVASTMFVRHSVLQQKEILRQKEILWQIGARPTYCRFEGGKVVEIYYDCRSEYEPDPDLGRITELPSVTWVRAAPECKFGNAQLEDIASLPRLSILQLPYSEVDGEGLARLKGNTTLERLKLDGVDISQKAMRAISSIPNLWVLELVDADIDDSEVGEIRRLKKLLHLDLSQTKVSDECIPDLLELESLRTLLIIDTDISEKGARRLRGELPNCTVQY